jgi:hypothetical protein
MSEGQPRDSHGRWASGGSVGNQPITSSAGQASVHTRLRPAAREKITINKMVDQSHYPVRTGAAVNAMTDHQRPMGSLTATPGRFKYQSK